MCSNILSLAANGSKWFAMRHGNRLKKLALPADQRKALIRSLVTETLRHGRITTTKVRNLEMPSTLYLSRFTILVEVLST